MTGIYWSSPTHFFCDPGGSYKLNRSIFYPLLRGLAKTRYWGTVIKPAAFRMIAGEDALTDYQLGGKIGHNVFCTAEFARSATGTSTSWAAISTRSTSPALDNVDDSELAGAPVRFMNGHNNNWYAPPAETRHL
jgi:hypothetical protein